MQRSPNLRRGPPDVPPPDGMHLVHAVLRLQHDFVVEAELALRHAAEVRAEAQRAHHLAAHHRAVGVHQQVHALHHVQEHLCSA
eukprot:6523463-Pyramimonas_sp.AAC.1